MELLGLRWEDIELEQGSLRVQRQVCRIDGEIVEAPLKTKNAYRVLKRAGLPKVRFHDLRYTYAVMAIQSGNDIKTVQENLGHATAAFTLDVYGHVTAQMKKASADRMEKKIQAVSGP